MASFRKLGKRWRARIRKKDFPVLSDMFYTKAQAQEWASRKEAEMRAFKFQDPHIIADKPLLTAIMSYKQEQTSIKPLGQKQSWGPEESKNYFMPS